MAQKVYAEDRKWWYYPRCHYNPCRREESDGLVG